MIPTHSEDLPARPAARRRTEGRVGLQMLLLALMGMALLALAWPVSDVTAQPPPATPPAAGRSAGHDLVAQTSLLTTSLTLTGAQGFAGWYVSSVMVDLEVLDGGAGVSGTFFRLDGSDWITYSEPFPISFDGVHTLDYYSVDLLENHEPIHSTDVRIDTTPATSSVDPLPLYQSQPGFSVSWHGSDNGGSGRTVFDVLYKDGYFGAWQFWLTNTAVTSAAFPFGHYGHTYYLESRAYDLAGNVESLPNNRGDVQTYINAFENSGFEAGTLAGWAASGQLSTTVAAAYLAGGQDMWSGLLGSPNYPPSNIEGAPGFVPANAFGAISQTLVVPSLMDMPAPVLLLWYHIYTYDVVYGCSSDQSGRLFDSFDVSIYDTEGNLLGVALRDGNYDCAGYLSYKAQHGAYPLTEIQRARAVDLAPYAGRTIVVELRNFNRSDEFNNTYTYVDAVRIINEPIRTYRVNLPVIAADYDLSQRPGGRTPSPTPTTTLRIGGRPPWR